MRCSLILIGMLLSGCTVIAPAPPATTPPATHQPYSDLIHITSPKPGSRVSSPITVTGEARGTWYFEASFPLRLEDGTGTVIAQSYAMAQDEWMTENFVPFFGEIDAGSYTGDAVLVFMNDNPSGLPLHEKEVRIPVGIVQ